MNALRYIRKHKLKLSQAAMAELTDATQATVSRWETGELSPNLVQLEAIRTEAKRLGVELSDSVFFECPAEPPANGDRPQLERAV